MKLKKLFLFALIGILFLQLGFVAWQVIRLERILIFGEEFVLRIGGYDPQDLLRGRYLQFSLTDVNPSSVSAGWKPRDLEGRSLWVHLKRNSSGYDTVSDISSVRKNERGWIRVKFDNDGYLIPPVSRFYLNEKDAPAAEKLIRENRNVRVRIRVKGDDMVVSGILIGNRNIKAFMKQ